MSTYFSRLTTKLALAILLGSTLTVDLAAQNRRRSRRSFAELDCARRPSRLGDTCATDSILQATPGWKRDALGNLILRKGSGSPRRVVACALDRPGFAITEINDEGYLRLREVGAGRQHPLWIQFHEGQRIKVLTRKGPVPGVVIVKSTHLQRGRDANAPVTTLEDLWVDVGATSKADTQLLGIEMLDPVVRESVAWSYGDYVSGPLASVRVGCAAVASPLRGRSVMGRRSFCSQR